MFTNAKPAKDKRFAQIKKKVSISIVKKLRITQRATNL